MAQDIFGFNTKVGNNFMESEMGVIIGSGGALTLVQSWNVQYQLQLQPIYECGTSTVYFSAKHAAGTLSCDRIVAEGFADIKSSLGEICSPQSPTVEAYTGQCSSITAVRAQLEGCVLTGVTLSGQAQNAYVGEQLTAQFVGMSIK